MQRSTPKGLILAGGQGTRLRPLTLAVNKHLLSLGDRPMIYYPLATLMRAGLREVGIVTNPEHVEAFRRLLGDGSRLGMQIQFIVQPHPGGLAHALEVARSFIDSSPLAVIHGDNLFSDPTLSDRIRSALARGKGATVFGYEVEDPRRFGVAAFDESGRVVRFVERPEHPPSNWAVTGLYVYDEQASALVDGLKASARGELEITDLNNLYLDQRALRLEPLHEEALWLDAGTHVSFARAARSIQLRQAQNDPLLGAPELAAFYAGWIDDAGLRREFQMLDQTHYADAIRATLSRERSA